ncbi:GNAT family N-acetyltransferase [Blastococcus sp. PRF04-17]|uniref:GNAT family N-acetyltransferase n=1 Tax=Blastococcus sp. PRF04-17 TaxID=2933797 RepID=UPI001FF36D16|nr:GNAT family N-acetyltransferase [Blastococcus sp. PRF04-17]UOY03730.1 GNAT family N-acetyltransferase [Blastococcus sp. PRF04-17]
MTGLPVLPEGFAVRPMTPDDAAPVAALLTASEQVDKTAEHFSAEDLTEWWTGWQADLGRDGIAVEDADGIVVGYALAFGPPTFRDTYRVYLEGRVRPDRRGLGIGRALLGWQLERGTEVHAERQPAAPGKLVVGVPETMPSLEALVQRAGLTAERWFRDMERSLDELPEPRPVPGVDLVAFSWDRDDEVRRAHNAAFTEHHGSSERDPESWTRLFTGQRAFRPELSVLAVEDGAVVGYVLTYEFEADTAATGLRKVDLGQIGVLPGARGRGLASAAIAAALRAAAAQGYVGAGLGVDTENVTGAMRLYENLGFAAVRTQVSWSRSLEPLR